MRTRALVVVAIAANLLLCQACEVGGLGDDGDLGVEYSGTGVRYELATLSCSVDHLESGQGCPSSDPKCLCRPEFDALNTAQGSAGNPGGKFIVLAQPEYGRRSDGSYAFDAYSAVEDQGNHVAHYVDDLHPSLSCDAAGSWSGVGCAGGSGCGWRCVTGSERADQIIDREIATYGDYPAPKKILLNEAHSTLYDGSRTGVAYRTWLRALVMRMDARGKRPLLYVQERHRAAGPFTYLRDIASHAGIVVEAYLSGHDVLAAPGQCAPPYDSSNWCVQQYAEIRNAVRNSARPAIPYSDLILVEHFATNQLYFIDNHGTRRRAGWGRTYDPRDGSPSSSTWKGIIVRRAKALQALPSLAGVGSYAWGGNSSGSGSAYRVGFATAWSKVALP